MQDDSSLDGSLSQLAKEIINRHSPNTLILDIDAVLNRFGSSEKRALRVLDAFLQGYPGLIGLLKAGADAKSAEALRRSAHALKGTLLDVGADGVAAIAAKIEKSGAEGDVQAALASVSELEKGTETVAAIIKEILSST